MSQPDRKDRKVTKPESEWRAALDPLQFEVTRHAATERAFTGKFWDHWQPGVYHCVCCNAPLFSSATKFDAGCGWPSYFEPLRGEIIERVEDHTHGMTRVEVRCKDCGAHLGHVFEDGPEPTGERFCINSASLGFLPKPDSAA
jgi:peptide-methionine (R)-S-oxide reductase